MDWRRFSCSDGGALKQLNEHCYEVVNCNLRTSITTSDARLAIANLPCKSSTWLNRAKVMMENPSNDQREEPSVRKATIDLHYIKTGHSTCVNRSMHWATGLIGR